MAPKSLFPPWKLSPLRTLILWALLAPCPTKGDGGDTEERHSLLEGGTLPREAFLPRNYGRQFNAVCQWPFTAVGTMCLYAVCNLSPKLSWQEARDLCKQWPGADLAILADGCQFADALQYIRSIIPTSAEDPNKKCNYWIGGSDADTTGSNEGNWRWWNGIQMPRGAPFWAPSIYTADTAPEKGENVLDFAYLDKDSFYLMRDEESLSLKDTGLLCQASSYWPPSG